MVARDGSGPRHRPATAELLCSASSVRMPSKSALQANRGSLWRGVGRYESKNMNMPVKAARPPRRARFMVEASCDQCIAIGGVA